MKCVFASIKSNKMTLAKFPVGAVGDTASKSQRKWIVWILENNTQMFEIITINKISNIKHQLYRGTSK